MPFFLTFLGPVEFSLVLPLIGGQPTEGQSTTAMTGKEGTRTTGSFLTQVWKGLLLPLGLGFLKGKLAPLSEGKTRALLEKPHSSPTLPLSQQSDLLTHPPPKASHTP